ncbi:hypothetical protein PGT21_003203 [Puccinia graminis f. sp. tritici]|uniref:Secreted protein n=1 Tax=Puccinia graminis f. sp. tritici TaxID=56615 RepID=A0A5B0LU47_PUCGR|nr:hypothetical protein PGT21_003203 [Puccinia graminis f. sp. tritici]KAA1137841.1 hypothetical protein PGTUg99_024651 [Puccinia graminis f. sp. tritici]
MLTARVSMLGVYVACVITLVTFSAQPAQARNSLVPRGGPDRRHCSYGLNPDWQPGSGFIQCEWAEGQTSFCAESTCNSGSTPVDGDSYKNMHWQDCRRNLANGVGQESHVQVVSTQDYNVAMDPGYEHILVHGTQQGDSETHEYICGLEKNPLRSFCAGCEDR